MPYEFFVAWRYLYAPRRRRALWLLLLLSALSCGAALWLFFSTAWQAAGAILLLGSSMGMALAVMMMFFSTFTAISVMGLGIGISILCIVLSVTSGFQDEFRQKVLGVNAHLLVLKYGLDFSEYEDVIRKSEALPGVEAAAPFVFHQMMMARGNRLSGVLVKGVDPKRVGKVLDLPRHLQECITPGQPTKVTRQTAHGQQCKLEHLLTRSEETGTATGIVIGSELAKKLDVHVGDPVRLISPLSGLDSAGWSAGSELPRSRDFKVTAIFNSGFDEYDKRLVYLNLKEAQAFFNEGDVVTGVEMKIRHVFAARKLASQLSVVLGGAPYRTVDWSELNQNLFTALQIQKLFLLIVIGFIVIVAAFNVLAALAVLVIRKTREISVLKSLGMTSTGVAGIFQGAGLIVWLVGTTLGISWGTLGCALLKEYGFPLDPKVYLISKLPVRVNPSEFLLTAAFALVVCVLATLYPAIRAARADPIQGLRA